MRKVLAVKIGAAMKRMKQMTALGRRLDQASARAWGCWVTATNSERGIYMSPLHTNESAH